MADHECERTERTALNGVVTCGLGLVFNIISVVLANSFVLVALSWFQVFKFGIIRAFNSFLLDAGAE